MLKQPEGYGFEPHPGSQPSDSSAMINDVADNTSEVGSQ